MNILIELACRAGGYTNSPQFDGGRLNAYTVFSPEPGETFAHYQECWDAAKTLNLHSREWTVKDLPTEKQFLLQWEAGETRQAGAWHATSELCQVLLGEFLPYLDDAVITLDKDKARLSGTLDLAAAIRI